MQTELFQQRSHLPVDADQAYAWHSRPGALEPLTPPWENARLVSRTGGIDEGDRVVLRARIGPLPVDWVAEHKAAEPGRMFRDVQVQGPFAHWDHRHLFEPEGPHASVLEDRVEFALPGGRLGRLLGQSMVRDRLERMFNYRHRTTQDDLQTHARYARRGTLTVAVTGSSGLIGSALVPFLTTGGHAVQRIKRIDVEGAKTADGRLDLADLEGADAVVHLAGESVAEGRWDAKKKALIRTSRVRETRRLAAALARMERPPEVLVCASAVGFYGDRGGRLLDESSAVGDGFLADVAREWEKAAAPARRRGIRVVHLRFGMVLSPRGGALARMLPVFRMGLGGRIGSGRQYWSWISIDDCIAATYHALMDDAVHGPVNVVAPGAVTNREFTYTLGKVLGRPSLLPMPAWAARLALGEMADALLLASARVDPRRLRETGYEFRHPDLETALKHLLGKR